MGPSLLQSYKSFCWLMFHCQHIYHLKNPPLVQFSCTWHQFSSTCALIRLNMVHFPFWIHFFAQRRVSCIIEDFLMFVIIVPWIHGLKSIRVNQAGFAHQVGSPTLHVIGLLIEQDTLEGKESLLYFGTAFSHQFIGSRLTFRNRRWIFVPFSPTVRFSYGREDNFKK